MAQIKPSGQEKFIVADAGQKKAGERRAFSGINY
jgi:hypothetical protein